MEQKPRNGIAGLRYWRYDLLAGLQVALVSLPLSLGIAVASGAPPVTGLISAIIAGLVFPFLGGAYVTISGPAAGLAPALLAGMLLLGDGDLAAGYPLLLVAICLTGFVQVVLSLFQAGRLVAMFLPVTVVEAMLAAIGSLIIIKQIPALLGDLAAPAKNTLASIANLPANILNISPAVALIGGLSLFLMFFLQRTRYSALRRIPPPLTVCGIGIALGYALGLDARFLVPMPENILEGGVTLPAFGDVWARPELWGGVLIVVITLTLIDGIESIATIKAVDKIDPFQRKSHPNVTLRAMGVSNVLSSIVGGLTIIPGGVKSRANIDAGGRTLWANFYNAVFLVVFLFLAKDLISRIPLAAIAAILVYVGWRLCEPAVFSRTLSIGRDQFIIFLFTVAAILATDLLTGILMGVAAEILVLGYLMGPPLRLVLTGRLDLAQFLRQVGATLKNLLGNPVIKVTQSNDPSASHRLALTSLTGFNLLALDRARSRLPARAGVTLAFTESARLIDHTAMEYLHDWQEDSLHRRQPLSLAGLEAFQPFTDHPLSARMRDMQRTLQKAERSEREQAMAAAAQRHGLTFVAGPHATLNRHDFIYLRRGANREERNILSGTMNGCHVKLFDYAHTAAPDYYHEHRHTLAVIRGLSEPAQPLPNLAITPGHYLERYLVQYREIMVTADSTPGGNYRVFGQDADAVRVLLSSSLAGFLQRSPGFYLEIRDNVLLAFRPEREREEPEEAIRWMTALAEWLKRQTRADADREK
jgi:MFS superfamily sulfate permease-like transporter